MTWKILQGDVLDRLRDIPDESVQCCVTSPPYWGLRAYLPAGHADKPLEIGCEATPDEHVAKLVEVFREVRRVLREDGVCWINYGSGYAAASSTRPNQPRPPSSARGCGSGDKEHEGSRETGHACPGCGGECRGDSLSRRDHTACIDQQTARSPRPDGSTSRGSEPSDQEASDDGLHASPSSTTSSSTRSDRDASCLSTPGVVSQQESSTSQHDAAEFSRTSVCSDGTSEPSGSYMTRTLGTHVVCLACGYSSIEPLRFKAKDLLPTPWVLAMLLQADGWWLRSDCIWCLSGGTWLYVRTQKGDMPMTVKDVARLDPSTVQLWNGTKWTRLLGMNKSPRRGDELEIVLRSGERISCTPTHRFPTTAGLIEAADLKAGDVLMRCRLPEPEATKDCAIDEDAAWFAGLYVAEGSRSGDTIQIAGHAKESERWNRVQRIAAKFGGSATMDEDGNNQAIRVYGKMLNAILAELVTGRTSHDKGFAPVVWRYSDRFVAAMVDGYLSGDGHADGSRWRLGFCRNYNLERDLRTACARLGYTLTLNLSSVGYDGRRVPTFRGELRKERSGHHNERDRNEIVEIRKSRCRDVYDLGVEDEPHLFALASGVLTHNSKPNPMPESVRDRPTKAHEYVFLLSKAERYFYDIEATKEAATNTAPGNTKPIKGVAEDPVRHRTRAALHTYGPVEKRNLRTVWTMTPDCYPEAHFAVFPEALAERCIMAGSRRGDVVLDPFAGSGTTLAVAERLGRDSIGIELNPAYIAMAERRICAVDPTATVELGNGQQQKSLFCPDQ